MAKARDYKAEYARRIASAIKRGKTRQSARGHKPQEHISRREREREEFGITGSEVRAIRAWCNRYPNIVRDEEEVIQEAASKGYDWFRNYRDVWNAARRRYLRDQANGTYSTAGMGYLEMLAGNADVEDLGWMYYH